MSFSQQMWADVAELYRRILALPFNRELAAGTLSRERFVHYLIQDAHYLAFFARALATTAARAPDAQGQVLLSRCAFEAIVVERALHESFFSDFGVTSEDWQSTPPSPTCFAYGHWLVSVAHIEPYCVALAALLPCFWIYHEVGRELHAMATDPHPYRKWIDTYADEAFARTVREVAALTDAAHAQVGEVERQRMARAYRTASRLEWMFWDAAYRLERWPV